MIERFKKRLKENGQSLKWFYEDSIRERTGLSYGGFCHQLNGYSALSDPVKTQLNKYIGSANEARELGAVG